jgi:hypothetical protein
MCRGPRARFTGPATPCCSNQARNGTGSVTDLSPMTKHAVGTRNTLVHMVLWWRGEISGTWVLAHARGIAIHGRRADMGHSGPDVIRRAPPADSRGPARNGPTLRPLERNSLQKTAILDPPGWRPSATLPQIGDMCPAVRHTRLPTFHASDLSGRSAGQIVNLNPVEAGHVHGDCPGKGSSVGVGDVDRIGR